MEHGASEAAGAKFRQVLARNPFHLAALHDLARVYDKLGQGEEAERRFALEPAATVFIDDRPDNIAAARVRGWQGIVHQDPPRTRAALAALGVSVP